MIYSVNNGPITLYGEAADDFLESIGVELYKEYVVIGEDAYLCTDGESILNENGVYLYEDHIVLEGQQAEEYKARKAKEKKDAAIETAKERRRANPYFIGSTKGWGEGKDGKIRFNSSDDEKRKARAEDILRKARNRYRSDEATYDNKSDEAARKSRLFLDKSANHYLNTPIKNTNHSTVVKGRRYLDTSEKYEKQSHDYKNRADRAYQSYQRTFDSDTYGSLMKNLKKQDKKNKAKHESTIFSDINII